MGENRWERVGNPGWSRAGGEGRGRGKNGLSHHRVVVQVHLDVEGGRSGIRVAGRLSRHIISGRVVRGLTGRVFHGNGCGIRSGAGHSNEHVAQVVRGSTKGDLLEAVGEVLGLVGVGELDLQCTRATGRRDAHPVAVDHLSIESIIRQELLEHVAVVLPAEFRGY